jgi:hypothetical protein
MSLSSGKVLSRRSWDIIPMPSSVINRVNTLGKDQPEQFVFTDRKGRPIGDIEPTSSTDTDDLNDEDHVEISGVDRGKTETEIETLVAGFPNLGSMFPRDSSDSEYPRRARQSRRFLVYGCQVFVLHGAPLATEAAKEELVPTDRVLLRYESLH